MSEMEMSPHDGTHPEKSDGGQMAMPNPPCTYLRVVLHGLVCVRLSYEQRTVELLVPSVPMHAYHFGTFGNFDTLPYGSDYKLEGVQVGRYKPCDACIKKQHIALSLKEERLVYRPRGLHATLTLPWPDNFSGVRQISKNRPAELFPGTDINPQELYYISYLSYRVGLEDRPALRSGYQKIWGSEGLAPNTTVHFFADPWEPLTADAMWAMHVDDAYGAVSDQVLNNGLALKPNTNPRWQFDSASPMNTDIPVNEAVDYPLDRDSPPQAVQPKVGDGGNCVAMIILD